MPATRSLLQFPLVRPIDKHRPAAALHILLASWWQEALWLLAPEAALQPAKRALASETILLVGYEDFGTGATEAPNGREGQHEGSCIDYTGAEEGKETIWTGSGRNP